MADEVTCSDAGPEDLPAVLELYRYLHPHDPAPDPEALRRAWDELLAGRSTRLLLAWQEGRAVATCVLTLVPNLTRGARPFGLIENVVTHPEYRRRGIGRRLLEHALGLAWARDCYKVMLMTGRNEPAVFAFYEQLGFIRGEKTGFVIRPDTPHPR